ncbi:hypothetical protein HDU93_000944 [Gonapodya sp. JEL0774]|nr:hypothetical protein HDU93_000944 [Gonapodya sp. JEL0774]
MQSIDTNKKGGRIARVKGGGSASVNGGSSDERTDRGRGGGGIGGARAMDGRIDDLEGAVVQLALSSASFDTASSAHLMASIRATDHLLATMSSIASDLATDMPPDRVLGDALSPGEARLARLADIVNEVQDKHVHEWERWKGAIDNRNNGFPFSNTRTHTAFAKFLATLAAPLVALNLSLSEHPPIPKIAPKSKPSSSSSTPKSPSQESALASPSTPDSPSSPVPPTSIYLPPTPVAATTSTFPRTSRSPTPPKSDMFPDPTTPRGNFVGMGRGARKAVVPLVLAGGFSPGSPQVSEATRRLLDGWYLVRRVWSENWLDSPTACAVILLFVGSEHQHMKSKPDNDNLVISFSSADRTPARNPTKLSTVLSPSPPPPDPIVPSTYMQSPENDKEVEEVHKGASSPVSGVGTAGVESWMNLGVRMGRLEDSGDGELMLGMGLKDDDDDDEDYTHITPGTFKSFVVAVPANPPASENKQQQQKTNAKAKRESGDSLYPEIRPVTADEWESRMDDIGKHMNGGMEFINDAAAAINEYLTDKRFSLADPRKIFDVVPMKELVECLGMPESRVMGVVAALLRLKRVEPVYGGAEKKFRIL